MGVKNRVIACAAVVLCFVAAGFLTPGDAQGLGALSLVPAAFLLVYIFITRRIIEALTLATVLGSIMAYKAAFFPPLNEIFLGVLTNEDMAWVVIVCGLMGGIVAVIVKSGGGFAFSNLAVKYAKTARQTLFATMLCSALLSIDDYLSVLVTGSCMAPVNNRYRIPREMLAYTIDTTAAPACVLNPASTWAIFIGGIMVANGLGEPGRQALTYIKLIPYNFYAIAALAVLILLVSGVIPHFGPMKGAFGRVSEGGPLQPDGSGRIDMQSGADKADAPANPKLYNFLVPIAVLIGSTLAFGFDMQKGVVFTVAFNFIFFVVQGMAPLDYVDEMLHGLKNMLMPLVLVFLSFAFAEVCNRIGFIDFVVDTASKSLTAAMLPFTVFIVFAFTEFIMGISWGLYVIAIPIVIPVAASIGVDPFLAAGAVTSAGVWGSHCCFYSDATILTSASTGCDNFRHAVTQLPYGAIAGFLAAAGYLVLGHVLY